MSTGGATRWKGLGSASCPLGICLLAIGSALWSVFASVSLIELRLGPPDCHACYSAWDSGIAPYLLALLALLATTSLGVYLGSRLARAGLVLALAGHVCMFFFLESFLSLRFLFQEHPDDLKSIASWWLVLWQSIVAASIFSALCWYLYGPRTANHFGVLRTPKHA